MQTLYTLETMENGALDWMKKQGNVLLKEKLNRSLDLFLTSILYTLKTAQYAEVDAHQKASRYLKSSADEVVNTKIAGNTFLWQLLSNEIFMQRIKDAKIEHFINEEWVKKIYLNLVKSDEYAAYTALQERENKSEKNIIKFIWEQLIKANESVLEYFHDELPGWEDDSEMTIMLMDNFFKNNGKVNFGTLISNEKEEYAISLLHTSLEKKEFCMDLIQPKLINWDAERVALIDLFLLRMGLCELLYFPTIPTKVTINEYIEIAKMYSTPQSGQFVNGVLDNILKELEKDNKIRKQDRNRK